MPETVEAHATIRARRRIRLYSKGAIRRLLALLIIIVVFLLWAYYTCIHMPGRSYTGPPPPLTPSQKTLAQTLRDDVTHLAGTIGVRNVFVPENYARAADWIESQLTAAGYEPRRQAFEASLPDFNIDETECSNIEAEIAGTTRPDEIVIIGAHYDSFSNTVGANDNASGVAMGLALARALNGKSLDRTLRFVFFANEEPPFFQSRPEMMGSHVYAQRCRTRGENIIGMIALETVGYYSDEPGSQKYPPPLGMVYPNRGHFIGFVSNIRSRKLLKRIVRSFRDEAPFPSEGGAPWGGLPGVSWSDHWTFWRAGYPALMITDTALYRYPHYHSVTDTPEKLDYEKMVRVTEELQRVFEELATE